MLVILGPAKTIDTSPHSVTDKGSLPAFLDHSETLVTQLRKYTPARLKKLMNISDKLATLTFERFAEWSKDYSPEEGIQALLAFSGEVFNGLKARTLEEGDLLFAQDHVRILSGLYGVLRPLDKILPYRLEMGTRMKVGRKENLYAYWKDIIPESIAGETSRQKNQVLINLASNEYFRSIQPSSFPHRVITPVFKESDGDGFRNVTIYAKKARGMMLRFILQNRLTEPEYLKAFDAEGYYFHNDLSEKDEWWFCR